MTVYDKSLRHARLNHIIFSTTLLYSIWSFWFLVDKNKCILQIHVMAVTIARWTLNTNQPIKICFMQTTLIMDSFTPYYEVPEWVMGILRSKGFNESEYKRTQNYVFVDMYSRIFSTVWLKCQTCDLTWIY